MRLGTKNLGGINLRSLLLFVALAALAAGCSEKRVPPTLPGAHPATWMEIASSDFHGNYVLRTGLGGCKSCHGADLNGGKAEISCSGCHDADSSSSCARCHGGTDNHTGAPPKSLRGYETTDSLSVGAHTAHLSTTSLSHAFACSTCHLVPLFSWDSAHLDYNVATGTGLVDSVAEVNFGGLAGNAVWSHATATCWLVYCHGSFSGGDTTNAPTWNGRDQALCGSCHDIGTNPSALGGIHDLHSSLFGLACADCHGGVVDSTLLMVNVNLHVNGIVDTLVSDSTTCVNCHTPGATGCTQCHGGTDNQTGAPPKGIHGETETAQQAVGAHTSHLNGGLFSASQRCGDCHLTYTTLTDSGHFALDSDAEIVWGGFADRNNSATWNPTANTCASTYCHGNFIGGKFTNAPVWTAVSQAECGSCHDVGLNPGELQGIHGLHVGSFDLACNDCHATVVDAGNRVTNRTLHVNGVIDTATADPGTCANCHAQAPDGCNYCHGGIDNQTSAPPKGLRGEISTTSRAVGAHTAHLNGGTNSDSVQCAACHTTYTNVADDGHFALDSLAEITWGSIANLSGGANWNRGSNTCGLTYCHGNFVGGKVANTPVWTAAHQADCGSCHDIGSNPSELRGVHGLHIAGFDLTCNECHANVVDPANSVTNRALHVNGVVDTAIANPAICANCHAPAPDGCVYCHGGIDNLSGAPPKGLRGETATTTIAVGAHTKHMNGSAVAGPLFCSDCHSSYTLVSDSGHFATDSLAEVIWGNFADRNGGAVWNRTSRTCVNTYCHGNFSGGITTNAPVWTSASQAACGSCHDVGIHPSLLLGEHSEHAAEGVACYRCHSATLNSSDQISDPTKHVDGIYTVRFWTGTGTWNASTNACSPPTGPSCHGPRRWY